MKNLAVILAPWTISDWNAPFLSDLTPRNAIDKYVSGLPSVATAVVYGQDLGISGTHVQKGELTRESFFIWLEPYAQDYDYVFLFWADCPFLDSPLSAQMWNNTLDWRAEYLFADGYPYGLAPEILKVPILSFLKDLAVKNPGPLSRTMVFDTMSKDIVAFDIETQISPVDLRHLRLSLTVDTLRNRLLCQRWGSLDGVDPLEKMKILEKDQKNLRTLPASFPVQVTDGYFQKPLYSPLNLIYDPADKPLGKELSLNQWRRILDQATGLSGDAVITLGLYHEPSLHSRFPELLAMANEYPGVSLVIETSGLGWTPQVLEGARKQNSSKVKWIVELDSDDPKIYQEIRGTGLNEVLETIEILNQLYPDSVWVQAVRMKEYEETYEGFWRRWKEKLSGRVIIQKYNSIAGALPDRKVSDLTPLIRPACWHLKRDMPIWLDGTVGLCFQDVKKQVKLGNAFTDELADIWNSGQGLYEAHLKDFSPEICRRCDEYYTFHF